jgi:hypothetical protein
MRNKLQLLALGLALTTQMIMAQVPSYVPTNGLVGYWPFNGNANDESGNGINGTVNGATLTTDRTGNANSAYNFTGTTNEITLNNSQNLINGSFSVSAWCTIDVLSPSNFDATLIGQFNGQIANDRKWLFGYRSISTQRGVSYYLCDNNGNFNPANSYSINWSTQVSTWYNITWVFSSGNSIKTYINGVLHSNVSLSLSNFNSTANNVLMKIGNGVDVDTTLRLPWNGKIDDIGIWNRVLTQQEITGLYNSVSTAECLTMVINTGALSTNPITYTSTVNIYPNPANDQITIDCGNLANVQGWSIKITNMLGQEVFNQPMNTQQYVVPLNTWTGQGMYFVKIINAQNQVVNIKKIILQ